MTFWFRFCWPASMCFDNQCGVCSFFFIVCGPESIVLLLLPWLWRLTNIVKFMNLFTDLYFYLYYLSMFSPCFKCQCKWLYKIFFFAIYSIATVLLMNLRFYFWTKILKHTTKKISQTTSISWREGQNEWFAVTFCRKAKDLNLYSKGQESSTLTVLEIKCMHSVMQLDTYWKERDGKTILKYAWNKPFVWK